MTYAHKGKTEKNTVMLERGKIYITTEQMEMARHDLTVGVKFKVLSIGYNWSHHTELKIISGNLRNNVHSSFFPESTKDYNGSQAFLPLDKLKEKLGMTEDIIVSFDPFNNNSCIPVKEIKE